MGRPHLTAAAAALVLLTGCPGGAGRGSGPPSPSVSPSALPSPSEVSASATPACSAAGTAPVGPQQLPPQVAATRAAVVTAAQACDYVALARLAESGRRPFTASFGGDSDPVASWRAQEERGEQPLRLLVEVLRRGHRERPRESQRVWPAAFGHEDWESVPQAARDELSGLYGPQDLAGFAEFGAYVGYRVGIADDGEWLFFVAGD